MLWRAFGGLSVSKKAPHTARHEVLCHCVPVTLISVTHNTHCTDKRQGTVAVSIWRISMSVSHAHSVFVNYVSVQVCSSILKHNQVPMLGKLTLNVNAR